MINIPSCTCTSLRRERRGQVIRVVPDRDSNGEEAPVKLEERMPAGDPTGGSLPAGGLRRGDLPAEDPAGDPIAGDPPARNLPSGAMLSGDLTSIEVFEFVFEEAPFASAHASTIVETPDGSLVVAWFGGSAEGNDDVEIWVSRKAAGAGWSAPQRVTNTPNIPVWNPVFHQDSGTTWLFYKVGPSPREWIGAYCRSTDGGQSWGPVTYLPAGLLGPIRTKLLVLSDGTWLAGSSVEAGYRWDTRGDAPYRSWAVWVERSDDRGATWSKHGPVTVPGEPYGVIQPTLWQGSNGEVRMLMRSTERIGRIVASSSIDGGRTWTPGRLTALPNPNSGIDAVKLRDGRLVLVYNHLSQGRHAIHLAVSADDGETWTEPVVLESGPGEYSYPAVIQSQDGAIHITYTWQRRRIRYIRCVV
jgi:predicted neuraminidase